MNNYKAVCKWNKGLIYIIIQVNVAILLSVVIEMNLKMSSVQFLGPQLYLHVFEGFYWHMEFTIFCTGRNCTYGYNHYSDLKKDNKHAPTLTYAWGTVLKKKSRKQDKKQWVCQRSYNRALSVCISGLPWQLISNTQAKRVIVIGVVWGCGSSCPNDFVYLCHYLTLSITWWTLQCTNVSTWWLAFRIHGNHNILPLQAVFMSLMYVMIR